MPRPPSSPGYVWEKMYVAVWSMCGAAPLGKRLEDATISALLRLEDHDLAAGELREDLKYVLDWTKRNMLDGEIVKLPDELELRKLTEKMLHVLLETNGEP